MILLVPFGKIENDVLGKISKALSETFKTRVKIYSKISLIPQCRKRGNQLDAGDFIPTIQKIVKGENMEYGLGIIDKDLYSGNLNFVFGIAYLDSCIISLARLKSGNRDLFLKRAIKEANHEIGHLFGFDHCPDPKCVMHFSNCLADTDIKSDKFCERCKLNV